MTVLVPILGDQLSLSLSSLAGLERADARLLMMEVAEEASYVRHHQQKIAFLFSAMRHHADALRREGWQVDYVTLDDPDNGGDFTAEVGRAVVRHEPDRIVVTEAGEWRVQAMLESWETLFGLPVETRADDRFLCSHAEFEGWAKDRADLRMEYFYRTMRTKTGLLMENGKPAGGRWNFDAENRKPAEGNLFVPQPLAFPPDAITREVLDLVRRRFGNNPGTLDGFSYAVTAEDAQRQQQHFLSHALAEFGDYQDAMLTGQASLWHSILSPYLNAGLLGAFDLCRAAEARWKEGRAPLNSVEGYIRQIIGWREFVRGIYWLQGPDYTRRNFFEATRRLPAFYWTGDTDMHCMAESIGQTLARAHAHHIQRLMVMGNFALLIGADPHDVHLWYLEIYIDAYEWVEAPNVIGLSQFADGGLIASKPYVSSGAYIDRMSDYCGHCRYDVGQKTGPDACPFNALYWDFLARNEHKLGTNARLRGPYATWRRMREDQRAGLRASAETFLDRLDASSAYD